MRRILVAVVWLAAVAAIVVAIGVRVRAHRMADPVQTLNTYVSDVPPEVARIATVIGRDHGSIQIELRADQRWIRTFAGRNGFTPVDGPLSGLAAERWILTDGKKKGAVLHLLLPLDGQPALMTVLE